MIVAVIGSRDYPHPGLVRTILFAYLVLHPDMSIISGGARGVDRTAAQWAKETKCPLEEIKANWLKGRGAGISRNPLIIGKAELVFAFWDGRSRGTAHAVKTALQMGKKVLLWGPDRKRSNPLVCADSY